MIYRYRVSSMVGYLFRGACAVSQGFDPCNMFPHVSRQERDTLITLQRVGFCHTQSCTGSKEAENNTKHNQTTFTTQNH